MATRPRSKTADPSELRKVARAHQPRKFTEKIAMMKKREAQHAAAFAEAMTSITEMQKSVWLGEDFGGSMPTLNQDFTDGANGNVKSIDLQLAFKDLNRVKATAMKTRSRHGYSARRNWSQGSKTSSDVDPYPINLMHLADSWPCDPMQSIGDSQRPLRASLGTSLRKSDSDLQHSLLMQEQQANLMEMSYSPMQSLGYQLSATPPVSRSNFSFRSQAAPVGMGYKPLSHSYSDSSTMSSHAPPSRSQKFSDSRLPLPVNYANESKDVTRKRPSSTSSAVASMEQYIPLSTSDDSNYDTNLLQPLGTGLQSKISSSLPDLTSANFFSGLERPIDEDRSVGSDLVHTPKRHYIPDFASYLPTTVVCTPKTNSLSLQAKAKLSVGSSMPASSSNSFVTSRSVSNSVDSNFGKSNQFPMTKAAVLPSQSFTGGNPSRSFNAQEQPQLSASFSSMGTADWKKIKQPNTAPVTIYFPPLLTNNSNPVPASASFVGGGSHKASPPPSYHNHLQQTAVLQHKLASISVGSSDGGGGDVLMRSHSDENLSQKASSSGGSNLQQNPFMGNMMSASSVPSIYVETNDQLLFDYPSHITSSTGDSPSESTTASHASSPPVRYSFDRSSFVSEGYCDWPLEGQGERGSLSHHKSLTELSMIAEEPHLQKPALSHQLSLPSIVPENGKSVDATYNNLSILNPFDDDLDFETDFSVLDSTQLPDMTDSY